MHTITIANLKGGSGKTTTVAYLAHEFSSRGRRVLVVDADPQGSALRWSEAGEWKAPTIALPIKNLHARLPGIVPPATDLVLIDTPPLDQQAGIVHSALRAADTIVVTMAPTMSEFERLADVWAAIEAVEPLKQRATPTAVLLNRTVANAKSTDIYRTLITDGGHQVLPTAIPRWESYAQAFAAPITDVGPYATAADDIERLGERA